MDDGTSTAGALLVRAADALHRFGMPAHRLEAALDDMARALGLEARVSATPTTLWVGVGPLASQRLVMLRVGPSDVDLGRLVELDLLMQRVGERALGPDAALGALEAILTAPRRWGVAATVTAGSLTSAGAAVLLGGGPADVLAACVLGGTAIALGELARGRPSVARVLLPLTALVVSLGARLGTFVGPIHAAVVILASLILLLPGLTFTLSVVELATGNLVSGVARLADAGVTLLRLVLGVAVAQVVAPMAVGPTPPTSLPVAAVPVALVVSSITAGILFQARARDLPVILVAAAAGWGGAVLGAEAVGPLAGAGVGAFVLAALSNAYARVARRPAATPLVAGLLLLLPGSFGFRSVSAMLEGDVLVGVGQGFSMAMTGTALAAGMLLAASVVPPGRAL